MIRDVDGDPVHDREGESTKAPRLPTDPPSSTSLPALARTLRRLLELERSFGWTPVMGSPAAVLERARAVARARRAERLRPPVASEREPGASDSERGGGAAGSVRPGGPRRVVDPPPSTISRAERKFDPAPIPEMPGPEAGGRTPEERARREALLRPLGEEVATCERCRLYCGRKQAVFGVGDPCARLLFVGEGPGADEDRVGEPFVGRAGQLLDRMIGAMHLRREDVYIANVVKCRPPDNRTPQADEMASCLPWLRRQIEIIRPDVIFALGSVAARGLLGTQKSVGALRGRFHDFDGIPVRVTYHPAYLLRTPGDKRRTWEDAKAVMGYLGIEV